MIELLNMDCMDYMAKCPDKSFDLAIVDPPYGVGMNTKTLGYSIASTMQKKEWDIKPDETYFKELFRISKNQFIWGGNNFGLPSNKGFVIWDKINYDRNFSEIEYCWTNMEIIPRVFRFGVLNSNPHKDFGKIHPCQKPIKLYNWIIDNYAKEGDKIIDTHLGSGSLAIAAHKRGFDFVGIELDKDYYDAACKRFKEQTAQLPLF